MAKYELQWLLTPWKDIYAFVMCVCAENETEAWCQTSHCIRVTCHGVMEDQLWSTPLAAASGQENSGNDFPDALIVTFFIFILFLTCAKWTCDA